MGRELTPDDLDQLRVRRAEADKRRRQVADLYHIGMTALEIARELSLRHKTVINTLKQVSLQKPKKVKAYHCTGCQRRVELRPCQICIALAAKGRAGDIQRDGRGLLKDSTKQY